VPFFQTDELVNAATDGVGLLVSIVGAIVLIARSLSQGDA
jgi:predicted membrane channel-forming protein YqfA (hemolysin III family)